MSKAMNHLLKSPFCVHPKTGRVCVPIDPKTADSFDPFKVPTVRTLCEEIDEYDKKNPNDKGITSDTDKTALKGAIDIFKTSFMNSMAKEIKAGFREKQEANSMDF